MPQPRILNPEAAVTELEATALSQEILAEAKAAVAPEHCARLDQLASQLHDVAPERIDAGAARIAFWVNLYNALLLHCLCLKPLRGSLLRHLRLFDRIAYRVGGREYQLNLIEHGLLRANRRAPFRLRRPLRTSDPRLEAAPSRLDPRIHFALNCGALSCPPIRVYEPESLDAQLAVAARSYLEAGTSLEPERRVVRLPRLMRLYRADFGNRDQQLDFAARHLPRLAEWLGETRTAVRVSYGHFDWTLAPPLPQSPPG